MNDDFFFYSFNGEVFGPFPFSEMERMAAEGEISSSGLFCRTGTEEWLPVGWYFTQSIEPKDSVAQSVDSPARKIISFRALAAVAAIALLAISVALIAFFWNKESVVANRVPEISQSKGSFSHKQEFLAEWYLFGHSQGKSFREVAKMFGPNSVSLVADDFSNLMQILGFDSLTVTPEELEFIKIGLADGLADVEERMMLPPSQKASLLPGDYANLFFEAPAATKAPTFEKSVTQVYEENADAFVTIKVSSSKGKGHGSGFFVAKGGYILTNRHVVEDAIEVKVLDSKGKELTPEVLSIGKDVDLALLKVPTTDHAFVTLSKGKDVKPGQQIVILGKPTFADEDINLNVGIISRSVTVDNVNQFQVDATINAGNSGGPAFDMDGNVVGVATWKLLIAERFNFIINIDEAIPILELHCPGLFRVAGN